MPPVNPTQSMAKTIDSSTDGTAFAAASSFAARVRMRRHGGFSLDVDLAAPTGFTILFGPSGAGKTTLLDCIAGLAVPDEGSIRVGARVFFDAASRINLPVAKRNVGYVFQDLALFPHLSVEGNVAYGLEQIASAERTTRVSAILDAFRIASLRKRRPGEISGGERQRVALARSLVTDPCILLLDEPLAALDARTKSHIVEDLRRWNDAHRIPILYVTHSREEVFALGERVVVLESGRLLAQGTPHEVMSAPRQETVAQLAGFENVLDAIVMAANEDRGTMTCRLLNASPDQAAGRSAERKFEEGIGNQSEKGLELETPLVRAEPGARLRIGIRAGDILLATQRPEGLSARNLFPGKITSLVRRDVIISARVEVGVEMEVHLTLAARDALRLTQGCDVWLIVKTHSCHLMGAQPGV
jgi:molybdate transport system ATP-binding protein